MDGLNGHDVMVWNEEEVRNYLENADLIRLRIGPDDDLERLGEFIGGNINLKELQFLYHELSGEDIKKFLHGFSSNESIKKLSFLDCGLPDGGIFSILVNFFKNNHNFECLEIVRCEFKGDSLSLLASALVEFDSLKEFIFSVNDTDYEARKLTQVITQALTGHLGLRKLILHDGRVGKNGCAALATLLKNPNTELTVLDLAESEIDDKRAAVLATGLSDNITLKDLNLSGVTSITETGWRTIFSTLRTPSCRLERLYLEDSSINDTAALSLVNALANNKSLRALELCNNRLITIEGWGPLFEFLHSPTCILEELSLRFNGIDDEVVKSLTNALTNNSSLRCLVLSCNIAITMVGWEAFSAVLRNPICMLENLDLSDNSINDETVNNLANAMVNNKKLRKLNLGCNPKITPTGWEALSTVLQNPDSALEKLHLCSNSINDDTMLSLANSLESNIKLRELLLDRNYAVTYDGWAVFSHILCNKSSIMDTYYHSNHTLQKICDSYFEDRLPGDVRSCLQLNRGNRISQTARLKIIGTHFREGFTVLPFVDMEWKVLPRAIAWMGRDGKSNELNGHFYAFIGSMSSLFLVL